MGGSGKRQVPADEQTLAHMEQTSAVDRDPTVMSRRQVLCAAALAGACAPLLAGCGSSSTGAAGKSSGSGGGSGSSGSGSGGGTGGGGTGGGGTSAIIATTSEVPKGGGVVLAKDGVVITQPKPGEFKGFSSTCTHMGCPLHDVTHGTINCICHGSQFSITNGHVVTGPATRPLPQKPITVHGKDISLA